MNNKIFRSSLVGLSMLAMVAVPAMSFAAENAHANVQADAHVNFGAHLGQFLKDIKHDVHKVETKTVEGTVSAINGTSFTVNLKGNKSATVQTNASTSFKMNGTASASLANVTTGVRVAAKGTWDSAHTVFTATKVAILTKVNPIRDWLNNLFAQHVINGKVTAVAAGSLTVQASNGTVYTVNDASAKLFGKGFASIVSGDIKVGDQVQVLGTVSGTSANAEIVHDISLAK